MSRREDGAALLGALIFVTICSILVSATLGFVDTDFRTTIAVREQREEAYAADAAIEAAIRRYQKTGRARRGGAPRRRTASPAATSR